MHITAYKNAISKGLTNCVIFIFFFYTILIYSCSRDEAYPSSQTCVASIVDTIHFTDIHEQGSTIYYDSEEKFTVGHFLREEKVRILSENHQNSIEIDISRRDKGFGNFFMGSLYEGGTDLTLLFSDKIVQINVQDSSIINQIRSEENRVYPLPPFGGIIQKTTLNGEKAFVCRSYNPNISTKKLAYFEESKGLTCINQNGTSSKQIAEFEENSIYRQFATPSEFHVIFDVFQDTIYYLRPFDRDFIKVATCDDENIGSIKLQGEHHPQYSFLHSNRSIDQVKFKQENSVYINLIVKDDFIYTQYREALNRDDILSNTTELNQVMRERKSYVDIYDRATGEAHTLSIEVPSCLYRLIEVTKDMELIFGRLGKCTDEFEMYRCKIACE